MGDVAILVFTPFRRPAKVYEMNEGPVITEAAGYIPAKVQIENMMLAGQRLAAFRAEMFDVPEGESDMGHEMDPTRAPNFDMADGSEAEMAVMDRLEDQAALAKAEADSKAVKKMASKKAREADYERLKEGERQRAAEGDLEEPGSIKDLD